MPPKSKFVDVVRGAAPKPTAPWLDALIGEPRLVHRPGKLVSHLYLDRSRTLA